MPIQVIGLNNKIAPIEIRELFSFDQSGVEGALSRWRATFPEIEATLVSTCNRTELYFASEETPPPSYESVFPFLIGNKRGSADLAYDDYARYFQRFEDVEAAKHLFSVASSLDSMILGEPQILSQIKKAYETATAMGATGPILNEAFQTAFKTAKRVSVETDVFRRRVSIPSVAVVDFALNIFERLNDKRTLVLGAGEMAEETVKYLGDYGARSIAVANRSREKAEALASQWRGEVVDWNDRFQALATADLVVCATGASEPVITLDDYLPLEKSRRSGRALFILDLAMPRNVDVKLNDRPNVYLYSLDDLEEACAHNKELREKELPKATVIVDEEARKLVADVDSRKSIDAIRRLREGWNDVKNAEVERLLNKIPHDERTESEIRYAFDRLVNKLLHSPTTTLRDAAQSENGAKLADALRRIFGL